MSISHSRFIRRTRGLIPLLVGVGALALSAHAHSQAQTQELPSQPLWELGAFGVGISQQAYPGSDQQVSRGLALPFFIYRGEFLRADRGTTGLRAIKTDDFELDIGVAGSFGSNSNDIEARRGMRNLGTLIEFGPRVKWNLSGSEDAPGGRWQVQFPLRGVFDLSDGGARRGLSFEPELAFDRRTSGGWRYGTSVSAILADQRLARTFYGVDAADALSNRPAYQARSGLIAWRLAASFSRSVGPDWRLFGFARVDSVNGATNEDSPLVRQTTGASLGLGVAYTWLRSDRPAVD